MKKKLEAKAIFLLQGSALLLYNNGLRVSLLRL